MTPEKNQNTETTADKEIIIEPANHLHDTIERPRGGVQILLQKLRTFLQRSTNRIGLVFAIPGILSLVFSVLTESQVLAFIGLGLTFWGALFFLVNPVAYVKGSLLNTASIPFYLTIDRIIAASKYQGKGLYIPPYPKDAYLPEHLKGLKENIVFISADDKLALPSVEEMATSMFDTKNPRGVIIIAPGSTLQEQFQKSMRSDITKTSLDDLYIILPQLIVESFQLAKEVSMQTEGNGIHLTVVKSVYRSLYQDTRLRSLGLLGCPLVSAIACSVAKVTGKPVVLQSIKVSSDLKTIDVSYNLMEPTA